jgi:hypothetical protein
LIFVRNAVKSGRALLEVVDRGELEADLLERLLEAFRAGAAEVRILAEEGDVRRLAVLVQVADESVQHARVRRVDLERPLVAADAGFLRDRRRRALATTNGTFRRARPAA